MKIVVLDGYASNPGDLSWAPFEEMGDLTVYDRTKPEELHERIKDAEIILLNKTPMDAAAFEAAPKLKLISVLATGYNIIDIEAAKAHGVRVCNAGSYSTNAVAQMTFALLLEATQQVGSHNAAVKAGQWSESKDFCFWNSPLTELWGKTMGLVGFGSIAQAVAKVAEAFGMKVIYNTRRPHEDPRYVSLDTLLAQSDIVSLHCPQTAENMKMINEESIGKMKDGAIVINTARGGLVDEEAVCKALEEGKLAYYAADVVSKEPIARDNPLLTAKNCYLTPHIAWAPKETRQRLHAINEENVRAFLAGKPQNVIV
ncbi:MAG: D-2-hydroxyacid dehydrogenase [Oscillospiraceae bacterium]|nr:D-2-hydroxyacid dehydrogenase [Oscillospiraceae bacterium]